MNDRDEPQSIHLSPKCIHIYIPTLKNWWFDRCLCLAALLPVCYILYCPCTRGQGAPPV